MIGTTISHYRITEKLGEGGMGDSITAQEGKWLRSLRFRYIDPQDPGR